MEKEMRMLQNTPGPGVSCWKHGDQDQLQDLRAQITGPEDTPYAGGVFLLSLCIPERYDINRILLLVSDCTITYDL
jgi:ubiquitin-conjugating enzyme E2 T